MMNEINNFFNVDGDTNILEIGAAQGMLCITLQSLGYSCSGIEPYEPAIEVAKNLAKRLNVSIDIKKGFGENIPADNNTFDLVLAYSVMEHVQHVNAVFREVMRILKPQGSFLLFYSIHIVPDAKRDKILSFFPLVS